MQWLVEQLCELPVPYGEIVAVLVPVLLVSPLLLFLAL